MTTSSGTALGVRTTAVPNAAMALTAPLSAAGATYPSPIRVLASPVDIAAHAPVPAKGAILTFHLNQATIAPVEHPFIASRNSDGSWTPVPTQYNPTAGTLSAALPHFSIWAPLSWSGDLLLAALKGGAQSIFGSTLDPAATPTCHATADLQVADSQPNGALRICATRTRPTGLRLTVVNTRRYPVDVSYPGGATVTVEPAADVATQVGAYINKVSSLADRRTVLPGHATATVELPQPGEGRARVSIDIDGIAYLTGILSVAIDELTLMSERLGSRVQANLEMLSARGCLESAMTDLNGLSRVTDDAVTSLTKVAISCAGDLFDTGASGAISDAIAVIAGLTDELAQSLYGLLDAATGASHHTLTVTDVAQRPATVSSPILGLGGTFVGLDKHDGDAAVAWLSARLGQPDHDVPGMCDTADVPGRRVSWGDLTILIASNPSATQPAGLEGWDFAWYYKPSGRPPLKTALGIGVGSTKIDVMSAYPDAISQNLSRGANLSVLRPAGQSLTIYLNPAGRVNGMESGASCGD